MCLNGVGDTYSFIDSYFAIFVTPVWVGGYLLFWNEVRALHTQDLSTKTDT